MTADMLSGPALRSMIDSQIAMHRGAITQALAPLDPVHTTEQWHATLRAIEEFINVPMFGFDDWQEFDALSSVRLDEQFIAQPIAVRLVLSKLTARFDAALAKRFMLTMLQRAALGLAFRQHSKASFGYGLNLATVGDAIAFMQSRRRHLVALLYTLPGGCKGVDKLASIDTLNVFMPLIEHSAISLTSLYQQRALADVFPDFQVRLDGSAAWGSHWFQPLESFFFDPERLSLLTLAEQRPASMVNTTQEQLDPKKIFSAAELRNSVRLIERAYAEFGLNDTLFATLAKLTLAFSRHCSDDYFVVVGKAKFDAMLASQAAVTPHVLESLLVNQSADYIANTNAFAPFMHQGAMVVSNVNLLMRFLYNFKNFALESRKRFQIHSGFLFESMVKRDLAEMGFHVTDIKRINRKEFDVVTVRDDVIYNFQCKNNWIDLSKIESDRAAYVRYNRYLVSYYERALVKEENREALLCTALGLSRIRHFVISRFPVMTDNPLIVAYNALKSLPSIFPVPTRDPFP
jgi:hypothetical protein